MKNKNILLTAAIIATSIANSFAQSTNPAPYCDGTFDDDPFLVEDFIKNVSFGTLSNNSDTQYAAPHYVFYNNLPTASFEKGGNYELKVTFAVAGGAGYGVWIDYNQDNEFTPDERIAGTDGMTESLDITNNTLITKQITIPQTALEGETRMRVRIVEDDNFTFTNGYAIPPCNIDATPTGIMDWGETEDYTIKIIGIPSSIEKVNTQSSFTIYPIPAQSNITIKTDLKGNNTYNIFNITGQLLANAALKNVKQQINIEHLSHGVYYIQLINNGQSAGFKKFIK